MRQEFSAYRMAQKFLKLQRRHRWKLGYSFADSTSDATSSDRNREKPNLSSLPLTIKYALHRVFHRFSLCHSSHFPKPTEILVTVVTLSGDSYNVVWFTCLTYQKRRIPVDITFFPSGMVIIRVSLV